MKCWHIRYTISNIRLRCSMRGSRPSRRLFLIFVWDVVWEAVGPVEGCEGYYHTRDHNLGWNKKLGKQKYSLMLQSCQACLFLLWFYIMNEEIKPTDKKIVLYLKELPICKLNSRLKAVIVQAGSWDIVRIRKTYTISAYEH